MQVLTPLEAFPGPDGVSSPATFYDGSSVFLCYRASGSEGGGNVVLTFTDVIDIRVTPMNVDGLRDCRYPVEAFHFNEVTDCQETEEWKVLDARLWLISFKDVMVEVIFGAVSLVDHAVKAGHPSETLLSVLSNRPHRRPFETERLFTMQNPVGITELVDRLFQARASWPELIKQIRTKSAVGILAAEKIALSHEGWRRLCNHRINHEAECRKQAARHIRLHGPNSLIASIGDNFVVIDVFKAR